VIGVPIQAQVYDPIPDKDLPQVISVIIALLPHPRLNHGKFLEAIFQARSRFANLFDNLLFATHGNFRCPTLTEILNMMTISGVLELIPVGEYGYIMTPEMRIHILNKNERFKALIPEGLIDFLIQEISN
jgi:hypothetical protein